MPTTMINYGTTFNNAVEDSLTGSNHIGNKIHIMHKKREPLKVIPLKRLAATYFSTNKRSIIGDVRLNFSVRNGKR